MRNCLTGCATFSFTREYFVAQCVWQKLCNTVVCSQLTLKEAFALWIVDTCPSSTATHKMVYHSVHSVPDNSEIIDDPNCFRAWFQPVQTGVVYSEPFRSGAGRCAASLHQWGYTDNPLCVCEATQTMSHIVDSFPVYKFEGGLASLHTIPDSTVE